MDRAALKRDWMPLALTVVGLLIALWQIGEHRRVRANSRQLLLDRTRDIARSLSVVLRSQTRFGAVTRFRVKAALKGLAQSPDLYSLALVNPSGGTVVAAGRDLDAGVGQLPPGTQQWADKALTVVEVIELPVENEQGVDAAEDGEAGGLLMLDGGGPMSPPRRRRRGDGGRGMGDQQGRFGPPPDGPPTTPTEARGPTDPGSSGGTGNDVPLPLPPRPDTRGYRPLDDGQPHGRGGMNPEARTRFFRWLRDHGSQGKRPKYPPWLSEEQYKDLFEKHGLQRFVLVVSAEQIARQIRQDLLLRLALSLAAGMAIVALGFGWRNLKQAAGLRLRLVRAQEMNTHLREMNTSAAGLAHETRNPLNSVRGLAQLIAAGQISEEEARLRARMMIAEVDRINSRLGEFIAYSRPKAPSTGPVPLRALVRDVARALEVDRAERDLDLRIDVPDLQILADSAQLRQVLFNLVLNGLQATRDGGWVAVDAALEGNTVRLTVRDNGSGVPPDAQEDIFRPYFTLTEEGTGLGLAVTRQIVLAHQWEITYRDGTGGGAVFEISGVERAS